MALTRRTLFQLHSSFLQLTNRNAFDEMTFHFRKIKETVAHVLVLFNHQYAASGPQTMSGRCVFKADGADWSHIDKYTGQTKAEVWLVTLLNIHTELQQKALCCGGFKSKGII